MMLKKMDETALPKEAISSLKPVANKTFTLLPLPIPIQL